MIIPDSIVYGAVGAACALFSWQIKELTGVIKNTIAANTEAFNQLRTVLEAKL